MKNLANKVAVITDAASGIGKCLAEQFSHESMRLVLADIEEPPLLALERSLKESGATVLIEKPPFGLYM